MTTDLATGLYAATARILARGASRDATLTGLLAALVEHLPVASAAIFTVDGGEALRLAATAALPEPAVAGLVAAVRDPAHPIARTARDGIAAFDVLPTAPGGPALRSHVPLVIERAGRPVIVGVLAIAHDPPMAPQAALVTATADLAAAAVRDTSS